MMYGQSSSNTTTANNNGVQICVEPLTEWKIQEIGYDGIEKYAKPLEFNDVLRKNARRVDWRKIVGSTEVGRSLDGRDDGTDDSDENEEPQQQTSSGADAGLQQQLSPADQQQQSSSGTNLYEPAAGPWASVGKHLHNALQEVHILLDALRITARTYYLQPVVNAPVQQDERVETEQLTQSKNYQLYTRKKAIIEAARLVDRMMKHRQQTAAMDAANIAIGNDSTDSGGNFTKELRELRECWRIRKVGHNIFGDLGYKTYVPKFASHELFDVSQKTAAARREATLRHSNPSYIGIRLGHNLRFRTRLFVFIQPDDKTTAKMVYNNNASAAVDPKFGLEEEADNEEEEIKHIHWRRALAWAQDTLICKDILAQLTRESVDQQQLISLSTERSIAISLFDNLLLRVELRFYPFQEMRLPAEGDAYLGQMLRELFMAEHTARPKRVQQFVNLAQTPLPDSLDMRGPRALSAKEIAARMRSSDPLIRRFVHCASHHVLVERTVDFLQAYIARFSDPQIQWKWIRATPSFSLISLTLYNRGFEHVNKFLGRIRIDAQSVTLNMISKEAQQISCRRDMHILGEGLLLLTANFLLNSLNILARCYGWQILHANVNAINAEGNAAPTFYGCNQTATKQLFVQFNTDGQSPTIFIRDMRKAEGEATTTGGAPKAAHGNGKPGDLDAGFCRLNYARLPGSTFMRKIDALLLLFISS